MDRVGAGCLGCLPKDLPHANRPCPRCCSACQVVLKVIVLGSSNVKSPQWAFLACLDLRTWPGWLSCPLAALPGVCPACKSTCRAGVLLLQVGKTSLMKRFCSDSFSEARRCGLRLGTAATAQAPQPLLSISFDPLRRATTGADFSTKRLTLAGQETVLQIWDTAGAFRPTTLPPFSLGTCGEAGPPASCGLSLSGAAGQERFHHGTLGGAFYRGADAAVIVYDVTNAAVGRLAGPSAPPTHPSFSAPRVGMACPVLRPGEQLAGRASVACWRGCEGLPAAGGGQQGRHNRPPSFHAWLARACSIDTPASPCLPTGRHGGPEAPQRHHGSGQSCCQRVVRALAHDCLVTRDSPVSGCPPVFARCRTRGIGHIETSAKDGTGVREAMEVPACCPALR